MIIEKFNEFDTLSVRKHGFRVGRYYDFSVNRGVRTNVPGRRLVATKPVEHLLIRIGPVTTNSGSHSPVARILP